jgi:hypothetical protein
LLLSTPGDQLARRKIEPWSCDSSEDWSAFLIIAGDELLPVLRIVGEGWGGAGSPLAVAAALDEGATRYVRIFCADRKDWSFG